MTELMQAKAWHKFFVDKIETVVHTGELPGSDEVGRMCDDSKCKLGKWIYSQDHDLEGIPAFENLKKVHGGFHEYACHYVMAHMTDNELEIAGAQADLQTISAAVEDALESLRGYIITARETDAGAHPGVDTSPLGDCERDDSFSFDVPMRDEIEQDQALRKDLLSH